MERPDKKTRKDRADDDKIVECQIALIELPVSDTFLEKSVKFFFTKVMLLEKPEARPADSAAYQSIVATGRAWLARGGHLYVILEDEAKGVALAREWDSARTWVCVR